MSTLSQARLAPLSHRYLLNRYSLKLSRRCQLLHYADCCHDPHWDQRNPINGTCILFMNPANRAYPRRFNTPPPIAYLSQERYNSDLEISMSEMLKVIEPVVSHAKNKLSSANDSGYHDTNRGHTNAGDSKNISMTLAATLAILGIFKKSMTGDIEEERAKLSDAEKLKRMRPVERKIAKGVLCMCDQDYGKADQLFHEALKLAQEEQDDEQENMVLNLIATNYFEGGDWENAEKLFIDLIKRMLAHEMSPTSPAILELSLKLASIYSKAVATHEKALKGFKFVINSLLYELSDIMGEIDQLDIQTLSDESKDALALLGWSYDWFAKHLLNMNDYHGAAEMLQRAFKISSKVLGQLHDQTLILLNDIGTTLAMNNAPEQGRTFIEKAVEGAIETQSKELASFYVNLGLVNLRLRRLQEAKRYCEYSIELVGKNREHHNSQEVIELSKNCLNEVEHLIEAEAK